MQTLNITSIMKLREWDLIKETYRAHMVRAEDQAPEKFKGWFNHHSKLMKRHDGLKFIAYPAKTQEEANYVSCHSWGLKAWTVIIMEKNEPFLLKY